VTTKDGQEGHEGHGGKSWTILWVMGMGAILHVHMHKFIKCMGEKATYSRKQPNCTYI
jgi:hypothetical protein